MGNNGGGPRLTKIDWEEFDQLCAIQCTQIEIAEHFNCSPDTISRAVQRTHGCGFAAYLNKKRQRGFVSIRRAQFGIALSGGDDSARMLIHLGKHLLGQTDKIEVTNYDYLDKLSKEELAQKAIELGKKLKEMQ